MINIQTKRPYNFLQKSSIDNFTTTKVVLYIEQFTSVLYQ